MTDLATELDLIHEEAVAVLRDISVQGLRNERSLGKGPPFVKLGRITYYTRSGLKAFVKDCTTVPTIPATLTSAPRRRGRNSKPIA